MYRVWNFVSTYSILLILGALIALIWANLDPYSYNNFVELVLVDDALIGHAHYDEAGDVHRTLTLHYLVNGVLMSFFFAIAAKEVWEAIILKNGALRGKKAATPLIATLGGMLGPIVVYLSLASFLGSDMYDAVARGWAIPTATDIAFAYLVGRIVFGAGHPALRFLLLLAIADDAAGLIILALFYPSATLALSWLWLPVAAAVGVFVLFNWLPRLLDRGNQVRPWSTWVRQHLSVWPYAVAGALSWYGFQESGLHPALGLLPIIPAIPHAERAFGLFAEAEKYLTDILNRAEHLLKYPVEIVLFFFGLLNAGVEFSSIGAPTWLVLIALMLGKPLGIFLFGWTAATPLRLGLPVGMRSTDLVVVGCVASIGFTVSLFIASVAFNTQVNIEGINIQQAAKMGALFSFSAILTSILVGKLLRVVRQTS